jgi:hypothetical protein
VSFLDAGLEGCEVVVGEVLLRGVVVVAVSSGFEVVDGVVLTLLDLGRARYFEKAASYLAGSNNLLVIKIVTL